MRQGSTKYSLYSRAMRTIDIRTTQNVAIEYSLASLGERALAVAIDLIIVSGAYLLLVTLVVQIFGRLATQIPLQVYALYLPIVSFIGYTFFMELLGHGQTLGKRLIGLKVMRIDGEEPLLSDYLLRAFFQLADLLFSSGVLGALLISSTPRRQRFGDLAANTTVIKVRTPVSFQLDDILRISSIDNYQPRYPKVRQLSEEDMLLIKTVLSRHQRFNNTAHERAVDELVEGIRHRCGLQPQGENKIEFLRTLIKDYIVLTR